MQKLTAPAALIVNKTVDTTKWTELNTKENDTVVHEVHGCLHFMINAQVVFINFVFRKYI